MGPQTLLDLQEALLVVSLLRKQLREVVKQRLYGVVWFWNFFLFLESGFARLLRLLLQLVLEGVIQFFFLLLFFSYFFVEKQRVEFLLDELQLILKRIITAVVALVEFLTQD